MIIVLVTFPLGETDALRECFEIIFSIDKLAVVLTNNS